MTTTQLSPLTLRAWKNSKYLGVILFYSEGKCGMTQSASYSPIKTWTRGKSDSTKLSARTSASASVVHAMAAPLPFVLLPITRQWGYNPRGCVCLLHGGVASWGCIIVHSLY